MKGAYLTRINMETAKKNESGVYKKIKGQFKCLADEFEMDFISRKYKKSTFDKIVARLPFTSVDCNFVYTEKYNNYDFLYIRHTLSDRLFIEFLKKVKSNNKHCKIILEINTYPYDGGFNKVTTLPLKIKDRTNRQNLSKYVDRIAIYSEDDVIFGIPTIKTVNGIEVDKISPKKANTNYDAINIISVATMFHHHGYDRLLIGMGEYYKNGGKRNIILHLVGDGQAIGQYKDIVQKYGIESHVIFYGTKTGRELDDIYDLCDMGVETIGWHRNNVRLSSSLKSREYWAKGLPIVTECDFPQFVEEIQQYIFKVPYNDTPINVVDLLSFYDDIFITSGKSKAFIINELRDFAQRTCDMKVAMQPIIDYIKSNVKDRM